MQDRPFLILAQSGRFLAQSLQTTGCPIWVADCFGDSDTRLVSSRWQSLPAIKTLNKASLLATLKQLSQGESCYLICGSGVESVYPFLTDLPENITLLGNSSTSIEQVRTPQDFFKLLQQLKINHPQTQFTVPENKNNWLIKSASGLGGTHIRLLAQSDFTSSDYFQYYQPGISGSGLFVANGRQAQLLSLNRHYYEASEDQPFRLHAIDTSLILSEQHLQELLTAIDQLTHSCHLTGLNSIDFIINQQDQLLITEINPRPTASAELLPESVNAAALHIAACHGQLPDYSTLAMPDYKAVLLYHYANKDLLIPPALNWPVECHDRPAGNTVIEHQHIVCSSVIKDCHYDEALRQSIEKKIFSQLNGT